MRLNVKLPKVGMTTDEGVIDEWETEVEELVKLGQSRWPRSGSWMVRDGGAPRCGQ